MLQGKKVNTLQALGKDKFKCLDQLNLQRLIKATFLSSGEGGILKPDWSEKMWIKVLLPEFLRGREMWKAPREKGPAQSAHQ